MILGFFPFQWSDAAVVVPTVPGLEFTAPDIRMHFEAVEAKMHFDAIDEDG